MTYHVFTQEEGSSPEYCGAFKTYEQALEAIEAIGGLMHEPMCICGDETYNLSDELGCPIAYIEEEAE